MTLIDYMAAGGEVVTDKIAAYVDKDVFNNLLKMSYGSMELIPAPEMVTTYTDSQKHWHTDKRRDRRDN